MTVTRSSVSRDVLRVGAALALLVGVLIVGYGLLLVPQSVLGGLHIAVIGLSTMLSGLFATERVADRLDLTATTSHRLSLALAVLAIVLLLTFITLNVATFVPSEIEESSESLLTTAR